MSDKDKKQERDHVSDFLIEWAPLINFHANKFKDNLPPHAAELKASDDLASVGQHGLMNAIHKYDPNHVSPITGKPVQFKTFASSQIENAMKSHIDSLSGGASRYLRSQAKQFKAQNPASEAAPVTDIPVVKPSSEG